jgi:hypothetical protein
MKSSPLRLLLAGILVLTLASCGGGKPEILPFRMLTRDLQAWEPSTYVFRDEVSWRNAWTTRPGPVSSIPPPDVDFDRELVVGVSLGSGSSSDSLQPVEVRREEAVVTIAYRHVVSGGLGSADILPLDFFLAIARPADSVQFTATD